MQTRIYRQSPRVPLALVFALLLVIAVAIPLYLSGSPSLRSNGSSPNQTRAAAAMAATGVPDQTQGPMPTPSPTVEAPAPPTATAVPDDPALATAVSELIAGRAGVYGIIIEQSDTGTRYSSNADAPFLAASLYKLVLIADIYTGIEEGVLDPETQLELLPEYFPGIDEPEDSYYGADFVSVVVPIDELLFATGAYSSNVAAHALLDLTDDSDLEAMAQKLGMDDTHFHVEPPDMQDWPPTEIADTDPAMLEEAVTFVEAQAVDGPLMLTTPHDMETYFKKLLDGEVVNPEVSALILDTLKSQAVDDRFPCLLPFETEMAHKTGNVDHVVHDVGIIWGADGPTILIAMIEDSTDDAEATLIIQRLALIAYGEEAPGVAEAYASPETTCGIVAPLEETPVGEETVEEEVPEDEGV